MTMASSPNSARPTFCESTEADVEGEGCSGGYGGGGGDGGGEGGCERKSEGGGGGGGGDGIGDEGESRTITCATKGGCSTCRIGMPKTPSTWPQLSSSSRASPAASSEAVMLAQWIVAATRTLAAVTFSEICVALTPGRCKARRTTTANSSNCERSPCRSTVKDAVFTARTSEGGGREEGGDGEKGGGGDGEAAGEASNANGGAGSGGGAPGGGGGSDGGGE